MKSNIITVLAMLDPSDTPNVTHSTLYAELQSRFGAQLDASRIHAIRCCHTALRQYKKVYFTSVGVSYSFVVGTYSFNIKAKEQHPLPLEIGGYHVHHMATPPFHVKSSLSPDELLGFHINPQAMLSKPQLTEITDVFPESTGLRVHAFGHVDVLFPNSKALRKSLRRVLPLRMGDLTFSFKVQPVILNRPSTPSLKVVELPKASSGIIAQDTKKYRLSAMNGSSGHLSMQNPSARPPAMRSAIPKHLRHSTFFAADTLQTYLPILTRRHTEVPTGNRNADLDLYYSTGFLELSPKSPLDVFSNSGTPEDALRSGFAYVYDTNAKNRNADPFSGRHVVGDHIRDALVVGVDYYWQRSASDSLTFQRSLLWRTEPLANSLATTSGDSGDSGLLLCVRKADDLSICGVVLQDFEISVKDKTPGWFGAQLGKVRKGIKGYSVTLKGGFVEWAEGNSAVADGHEHVLQGRRSDLDKIDFGAWMSYAD